MSPLTPHWEQPSHPAIQTVEHASDSTSFTTRSLSKVSLPPFAVFAKLSFPPCTVAPEATYATVQMGKDSHLNLNSDLLYINHSCEPSLIFDMSSLNVLAGPKGLQPGDELTFFYPSTEWSMAQPFTCNCATPSCRGTISGARDMPPKDLQGLWLSAHIRQLLEERDANAGKVNGSAAGKVSAATLPSVNGTSVREAVTSRELSGEMGGDTATVAV